MGALCVYLTYHITYSTTQKCGFTFFNGNTHELALHRKYSKHTYKGADVRNDGFNGNNVRKGVLKVGYQTHIILYSADSTLLGPVSIPIPQSKCYPQGMVWVWEPSSLAWYAML